MGGRAEREESFRGICRFPCCVDFYQPASSRQHGIGGSAEQSAQAGQCELNTYQIIPSRSEKK